MSFVVSKSVHSAMKRELDKLRSKAKKVNDELKAAETAFKSVKVQKLSKR